MSDPGGFAALNFQLQTLIISLGIMIPALVFLLASIKLPSGIDVRRKKQGDTDGDGVLSPAEINAQLEAAAASLKLPLSVVQGYWSSFQQYDADDSGSVDAKELGNLLVDSLGHKPSPEELNKIVLDVDTDGSGSLEFGEFCALASKMDMGEQGPEELQEAFLLWSDGGQKIPGESLRKALTTLGEKLSEEEMTEFMEAADVDGDGTIDYDEVRCPCLHPVLTRLAAICRRCPVRLSVLLTAVKNGQYLELTARASVPHCTPAVCACDGLAALLDTASRVESASSSACFLILTREK